MTAYKVLSGNQSSYYGGSGKWVKNRWRSVSGELAPCNNGIHYCTRDQLVKWLGPSIWLFEDGSPDETIDAGDKMVTRRGRVTSRIEAWNEKTARLFAADCAEAVVHLIPESEREPATAAIDAARRCARGEESKKELRAATDVAYAYAAAAATDVAYAYAAAADAAAAYAATDAATATSTARAVQTELLFDYLEGRRS